MEKRKRLLYIGNKLASLGKPPTSADTLPALLEREGYALTVSSGKRNKILRLFDMMRTTYRNRKRVDVVIIDTYSTWNFYYAVVIGSICRKYRLPYIPILHGGNLPSRLKNNKALSRKLFMNAWVNVAPSRYMMEIFRKEGFNNLVFIPNTIEIDRYPFLLRKSCRPKLLWVRSFAEIYNPELALHVVALLKKKGREVELCMIGPEKDLSLQKCKKIVEDLDLPVTFLGLLSKEDWIHLSRDFDIFLNTTHYDNMPVSVMEAMALGLPVVSTNVGGMPHLIQNGINGILVPPSDASSFVTAIETLCDHPAKAESVSFRARKEIERFDWDGIRSKWIGLLDF